MTKKFNKNEIDLISVIEILWKEKLKILIFIVLSVSSIYILETFKKPKNMDINSKIVKLKYSKGSVYHQYVIKVKNLKKFTSYLSKNKIPFGRHYPYPIHKLSAMKDIFKGQKFVNAEELGNQCVSLPVDPFIQKKDFEYICEKLNSF